MNNQHDTKNEDTCFSNSDHQVDIYDLVNQSKTGIQMSISDARQEGQWLGAFNLWILQRYPVPAILYQLRAKKSDLWPNLLDVSAGGHYRAGESVKDGLREVREELGKVYQFTDLTFLGKKLFMQDRSSGEKLRYIVDVFLIEDNSELSTFDIQQEELDGLFVCPISELIRLHSGEIDKFTAHGILIDNNCLTHGEIDVSADTFPVNWDRYHFKMALIASLYFGGVGHLLY